MTEPMAEAYRQEIPPPMLAVLRANFLEEDVRWKDKAACREADPQIFDTEPRPGFTKKVRTAFLAEARKFCDRCTVISQCLEYATKYNEPTGIWGGMSPAERRSHVKGVPSD